jgi:hypothetical protein
MNIPGKNNSGSFLRTSQGIKDRDKGRRKCALRLNLACHGEAERKQRFKKMGRSWEGSQKTWLK